MYDFLLTAHLLAAVAVVLSAVFMVAWQLGVPVERGHIKLSTTVEQVGAVLVLIFGVWLALYVAGYEIWDGWILGALVLYIVAAVTSARAAKTLFRQMDAGGAATVRDVAVLHGAYIASIAGILALMIFKPGA